MSKSPKRFRVPFRVTMRIAMLTAAVLVSPACDKRPEGHPLESEQVAAPAPEPAGPRVVLPSVPSLGPGLAGPADDGPAEAEKWLRKVSVTVPMEGAPVVTGVADASRWRGIALPRDTGQDPVVRKVTQPTEVRVKIYWANSKGQVIYNDKMPFPPDWPGVRVPLSIEGAHIAMKLNNRRIGQMPSGIPDLNELARELRDLAARNPMPVVIDARAKVPFVWVMWAIHSCLRAKAGPVKFQAPAYIHGELRRENEPKPDDTSAGYLRRLEEEAQRASLDAQKLPNVSVRIRAAAFAPYGAVQNVMLAAMRARIWRLSFVGRLDGREVEIGPVYDAPDLPDVKEEPPVFIHEEVEIFEAPVFVHEEVEISDHMMTGNEIDGDIARGHEDPISDIPLVGTGVVGSMGIGGGRAGAFDSRLGGGRRRAALRFGGSRRSEAAVDKALEWLWRHQESDGHWEGERKFEAADPGKNTDAGVTGLALLAFLGAGHTEKIGLPKYRVTVKKAVGWLVKCQAEDGAIGDGFEGGLGYHHAIAGLALAEAYGMARVESTGVAAQKAVDYSVNVHQTEYSGWRYKPKTPPDTSVTGWFVAQLESARVAGLMVDGKAFQGAIAWLDKCTDDKGLVSYQPERSATPTMTAVGVLCRQFMGWKRVHPLLIGGTDHLRDNLPQWGGGNVNFYYWYYGTLALFQMGGDWWKAWNASLRDMLVERQRKGEPKIDGSWDPVGAWCGSGGRAYATAMGALCLEVYYRYLPVYK